MGEEIDYIGDKLMEVEEKIALMFDTHYDPSEMKALEKEKDLLENIINAVTCYELEL